MHFYLSTENLQIGFVPLTEGYKTLLATLQNQKYTSIS